MTDQPPIPAVKRFTRTMWWTGAAVTLPYIAVLWNFTFLPFRRAYENGLDSDFFDLQARAFLRGDLHVEKAKLGIEAFVIDGKDYIYFPPFPSLLRLPFLIFTSRFDSYLTAPFMVAAWLVTLVFTALLLWRVRCILRPDAPLSRAESAGYAALFVAMTAGSVLIYLASMPWVFHEVYAWAIALSIATIFFFLGVLTRPSAKNVAATTLFVTAAVLTRTTIGWSLSIAIVLAAAWSFFGKRGGTTRPYAPWLGAGGVLALVLGSAVNYAKFSHPFMFPLQNQVWTEVNAQRRAALAANGGDLVSPNILWSTSINYLRPDGIRFTGVFPFITLPADRAPSFGGSFLDQSYRTGSVSAFMPLLTLLCLWGLWVAFRPRNKDDELRDRVCSLRFPLLGAAATLGGIMFYAYIAHRYTAEFMPLLVLGASIGGVDLLGRVSRRGAQSERWVVGGFAALALFGLAANSAVALTTERQAYSGQPLRQYVIYQKRISDLTGHPLDSFIEQSDDLPLTGPPDELRIIGDCDALWMSNGDDYNSWVPVEVRDLVWEIRVPSAAPAVSQPIDLVRLEGWRTYTVSVEHRGDRLLRIAATVDGGPELSYYVPVAPGSTYALRMKSDPYGVRYVMEFGVRDTVQVPMLEFDPDWNGVPLLARPVPLPEVTLPASPAGSVEELAVSPLPVPELTFCNSLLPGD